MTDNSANIIFVLTQEDVDYEEVSFVSTDKVTRGEMVRMIHILGTAIYIESSATYKDVNNVLKGIS